MSTDRDIVVSVEGAGKRYRAGEYHKYRSLRDTLTRMLHAVTGGATGAGDEGAGTSPGFVWVLRDVSLSLARGESVGIIGGNGAGKSTLLKMLARITRPTEGAVEVRGRIGSLLDVGAGFHRELTGRENIYLGGAVLGMRKRDIDARIHGIADFAEIGRYIDTPVKHYSSGMYLRLAFSIAMHLKAEVLLIDEVLSSCDAAFMSRCLRRLDSLVRDDRTTMVLVSHDMELVRRLCRRCVWLKDAAVRMDGLPEDVIAAYLSDAGGGRAARTERRPSDDRRAVH